MATALDTAEMVRNMEDATMDRKHAEAVAKACKSTYEAVSSNLVTKGDMDTALYATEKRMMRWTLYVVVVVSGIASTAVVVAVNYLLSMISPT